MSEFACTASAPGVVYLFGEYGKYYGEPSVAVALDLWLKLSVERSEFEFHVVDDHKMEPKEHENFISAIEMLWSGEPLDFKTSSQMPMITGLGTQTTLNVLLTSTLLELNKKMKKNPKLDKKMISKSHIVHQAFELEKAIDQSTSPIGVSTVVAGDIILMYDIPAGALWSISTKKQSYYFHKIESLEDISIVIGYQPKVISSKTKYSASNPLPLFSESTRVLMRKKFRSSKPAPSSEDEEETILNKLQRYSSRSGFAKDIIKDMGKITRKGVQALIEGDIVKVGEMMEKQENLVTILGIYPENMRSIAKAIKQNSYGVTLTGAKGDTVLALTDEAEVVAKKIKQSGGKAIISKISRSGLTWL